VIKPESNFIAIVIYKVISSHPFIKPPADSIDGRSVPELEEVIQGKVLSRAAAI